MSKNNPYICKLILLPWNFIGKTTTIEKQSIHSIRKATTMEFYYLN